jgi:NADH-ubiquinone oxidoreductase chain 5
MSQLGMMVIAIGLSSYHIALFHLVNHAFYKGLLFLAAGAVIHGVGDNQDFRKYGGLRIFLPLTYSVILIASLSLVAFPFMTGFYSKDLILESAFGKYFYSGVAVYVIAVIGAIFTTLYSVKVLYLTFLTNPNGSISYPKHAHEGNKYLSSPLAILAVFSIFFGFITKDLFIGLGSNLFIDNSVFIHPMHEILLNTEFAVPVTFKLSPFFLTVSFIILTIVISEFFSKNLINWKFSSLGYNIFGFFNQRFLIEMFYNIYITKLILNLGGQTTRVLDRGSIEYLGPHGFNVALIKLSKNLASLSKGVVTSYALYILMGIILYLLVIFYLIQSNSDLLPLFILIGSLFLSFNKVNSTNSIIQESNFAKIL